jgi:hypothetical protein
VGEEWVKGGRMGGRGVGEGLAYYLLQCLYIPRKITWEMTEEGETSVNHFWVSYLVI